MICLVHLVRRNKQWTLLFSPDIQIPSATQRQGPVPAGGGIFHRKGVVTRSMTQIVRSADGVPPVIHHRQSFSSGLTHKEQVHLWMFQDAQFDENSEKTFYDSDEEKDQADCRPYVMDPDHRLLLRNTKPLLQSRNTAVSREMPRLAAAAFLTPL